MIVVNLSGWKRPADIGTGHAGEFSDVAWARGKFDSPYPDGGWSVPGEGADAAWRIVSIGISPSVVREEDGTLILFEWNGSSSDPRIIGIALADGEELTRGYKIGPAPIVHLSVTTHTGVAG